LGASGRRWTKTPKGVAIRRNKSTAPDTAINRLEFAVFAYQTQVGLPVTQTLVVGPDERAFVDFRQEASGLGGPAFGRMQYPFRELIEAPGDDHNAKN
jgi:hypothetical protein